MNKIIRTAEELEKFIAPLMLEGKYAIDIQELPNGAGYKVQWQEHKTYTAQDGEVFPEEIWFTEAGEMLQVQDISVEHCRNIVRMIIRNERKMRDMMNVAINHIIEKDNASEPHILH